MATKEGKSKVVEEEGGGGGEQWAMGPNLELELEDQMLVNLDGHEVGGARGSFVK